LLACGEQTSRAENPAQVAGFISERWPASNRNPGRLQIGISGRIESEFACAGARKEVIGNGITNAAQAEFVTALPFLEQRHDPLRTLALGFIEINPG